MTDDGVGAPMPRTDVADIPQQELLDAVRAERDAWVDLVRELAEHESPSTEPDTQTPVLARMAECLTELGLEVGRVPGRGSGGLLLARGGTRWRRDGAGAQLLLGHSDTVWPVGTLDRMPVEIVDGRLRGPGVFDMKAGLAQMVFALRALRACGRTPEVEPVLLINSDEETGSGESERQIRRLARHVCRAWVLEPALDPDGKIKTARKGVGHFTIRITGRSAHSGLAPQEGASAIGELAHVVQQLHALTDFDSGTVVNVGQVRGGTRPNVVAAEAEAVVDMRVGSVDEGERVAERIRGIEPSTPGVTLEVVGGVDRPPMEHTPENRRLWHAAQELGRAMGVELAEGRSGGASDGNTTNQFTPTLDGLGAVGDGAHALHEYVDVDRSLERCALLAGLLLLPAG